MSTTHVAAGWTFLTNHAQVLLCIDADPDIRIRDVATMVGITERATQRIVSELERSGYLSHQRIGRRNRYQVHSDLPVRGGPGTDLDVGTLLRAFTASPERNLV